MTRLLLLSFLILQLTGCASWLDSDYRDPEVRLVKVEAVKMHLLEQEFVLHVRVDNPNDCLLYTSPSPRDLSTSRMPSSA